jgi:hypothetical protein
MEACGGLHSRAWTASYALQRWGGGLRKELVDGGVRGSALEGVDGQLCATALGRACASAMRFYRARVQEGCLWNERTWVKSQLSFKIVACTCSFLCQDFLDHTVV